MSQRTLPLSSAPYGGLSSAPWRAPSLSPPRSSCRICCEVFCTSAVESGATAGVRELRSKLAGLSGSRASILIVRQLMLAMAEAVRCCWTKAATDGGLVGGCAGGLSRGVEASRLALELCGEVASRIVGCSQGSTPPSFAASTLSAGNVLQNNFL